MATIQQLNPVDQVSSDDQVPIYKSSEANAMRVPASAFVAVVAGTAIEEMEQIKAETQAIADDLGSLPEAIAEVTALRDQAATSASSAAASDASAAGHEAGASDQADRAEAAAVLAEDATYDYWPADATALAAITGMTTGQKAFRRDNQHIYKYSGSAWVDQGLAPSSGKLDQSVFYTYFTPGGIYPFRFQDLAGRMAIFTDTFGSTFLKLHSAVTLPGGQLVAGSVPAAALAPSLFSRMLPDGFTFSTSPYYLVSLTDANKCVAEFALDMTGRFPAWVARALAGRAQVARAGVIGRSVRLSEVYCDASALADGSTIPLDTGQASYSFGNAPLKVVSGQIVHDSVQSTNNAGYLQVALAAKVRKIGVACVFPPGSELSSVDLVLPLGSWRPPADGGSGPGGTMAGVHYVMLGNGSWHCSVWSNLTGEKWYASGTVAPLADGLTRMIDIEVDGNTVTVKQPDGSVNVIADSTAAVAANISNLAIWEIYESATQPARAAIKAFWAESPAVTASKQDARSMAVAIQSFLNGY